MRWSRWSTWMSSMQSAATSCLELGRISSDEFENSKNSWNARNEHFQGQIFEYVFRGRLWSNVVNCGQIWICRNIWISCWNVAQVSNLESWPDFGFQSPTGPRGCGPFIQLSMCENITIQLIGFGKIAFKK